MPIMLIKPQPQQSTTPPTQQLTLTSTQPMISSPTPQNGYDVIERLKHRYGKYRLHHQMSYQKNQNTIEAQNLKMKSETNRLQQQFLNNTQNNNNNSKSKQQKSFNTTTGQRSNKRTNSSANNTSNSNNSNTGSNNSSNAKCESIEPKPNKLPKLAANRNPPNNSSSKVSEHSPTTPTFQNNSKFNTNSQSNQMDIKMKSSVANSSCISTTISQPLIQNNSITSVAPEIKREVIDNSYFEGVTVDAIRDFLAATNTNFNNNNTNNNSNGFAPNAIELFGSDIMKDLFNDSSLVDDGLASANFGDEDFITKFLEEINESDVNESGQTFVSQPMNTSLKSQHIINHSNNNINYNNNNVVINTSNALVANNVIINSSNNPQINSVNFNRNPSQTPTEITSYQPIQPRLQPNLMSNFPNRSSAQVINSNNNSNFANVVTINNNNIRNYVTNNTLQTPQQTSGLLLQQTSVLPQQIQQQSQHSSHLILQQQPSQPVHLRLSTASVPGMGVVSVIPKTENVSVQLSIQVPQQTQNITSIASQVPQSSTQPSQASVNASIKLKQMAQQVQQTTQQWVINHSNIPLTQMPQQLPQPQQQQQQQRLVSQTPQQRPTPVIAQDQQNQIQLPHPPQTQTQNYFTPQMAQQLYWQQHHQQQQNQQQQQHQQQQHQSQQHQQQQTQPQQQMAQNLQQNQQNFSNYWSNQSHEQIVSQPSQHQSQHQTQLQPQQQQTQHYYNNNYNYFG